MRGTPAKEEIPSSSFTTSSSPMTEANHQQSAAIVFAVAFCSLILLNSQGSVWELESKTVLLDVDSRQRQYQQPLTAVNNLTTGPAAKSPAIPSLSSRPIANFLLAGAQKAGTTALANYLSRRRDTCGPTPRPGLSYTGKEAHFFDEESMMEKGLGHYESLFRNCGGNETRIIMDATPKYMLHPENVRKIYEEHGSADTVKIMFTLREPVSREMSWYTHLVAEARRPKPLPWSRVVVDQTSGSILSFEDYVEAVVLPSLNETSEAARGLYAHWLMKWFALFDPRQILITSYDDFRRNETEYLMRVHEFLDLPDKVPRRKTPVSNTKTVGDLAPISCQVQTRLANVFAPYNEELYRLLRDPHVAGPSRQQDEFPRFRFQCKEG